MEKRRIGLGGEEVEPSSAEVYDELLSRYERVLVYAGQLQEKIRQGKLLAERNTSLQEEKTRLQKLVSVEKSYVRLLENALKSLGVLKKDS